MLRKLIIILSLFALIISLLPYATSLYDLTGEEGWAGQLAGVVHWVNTAVRPQPRLAVNELVETAVSPFGMNTFLQSEVEPEKRARSLQLIHDAGFRFIRQEFTWEDIEIHGKGDFTDRRNDLNGDGQVDEVDAWAKYDNIVDLAEEYDIDIIARLGNPPAWTRALTNTIGTYAPPDDFNDYGDFVAAVAERYNGRIHTYQLWNEPNGNDEWGLQDVNPEAYTALLCVGYQRIKAVDPQAVVLAGALTPTVAMNGRNMNDLIFLERMYQAGAGDCFDVMSAQGYGLWSGPTDQRLRPTVINYPHHLFIRDIMVRHGDAAKPIWISEMAWNTAPDWLPATYGRVTETQQAAYGAAAYQRAQEDWPWLSVINYWFFKRPADYEKDQSWYYFRVLEPDFTPLPVYAALSDYANKPTVTTTPDWVLTWMNIRPTLFILSSAVLFFMLLHGLMPQQPGDSRLEMED
ncbi:MAG: cellulase family glycosylhydrolase [Anaerolineales bacterium]|nr:cellulase family glycosylhydrolase [Anaerolineales bacterium]